MAKETGQRFPSTSPLDLLRLAGGMAGSLVRGPGTFDASAVFQRWMEGVAARRQSRDFVVNLFFKRLLLVTSRDLTDHILEHAPSSRTYMEGPSKSRAMSFLAPRALTICHDQQWQRLRPYNEQVLSLEDNPQYRQAFLNQLRQAFTRPVSTIEDIRRCMGQVMLGAVFGEGKAPANLAEDIEVLFGYVQSPVRRMILGGGEKRRRERFYSALERLWGEQDESQHTNSLLSTAKVLASRGAYTREELLEQIPHWMFTFTGSGTDLLSRTLALVASRPAVRERVEQEIAEQGPLDRGSTIEQLEYLEACLLETCRLFPPVTRTLHVAPRGDVVNGRSVPAGMEILHYFTARQRDTGQDPTANDFRPERWMGPDSDAAARYPNLFLGGARACPGQGLILFICKAAAGLLFKERNLHVEAASLASDPLPGSFPGGEVRFRA